MASNLTLYEIGVEDGSSVSPFVWRIKLALAHKGIPYRSRMLSLTDIPNQFGGRFQTVPILDFGDRQINESLAIADQLDQSFPDLPAIFSCQAERALVGFFDHWLRHVIVTFLLPIYALDAHNSAATKDRDYYRQSREAYFGQTLEEVVQDRQERLADARRSLEPARQSITSQSFVGGAQPNFADMCMLGLFAFVGAIGSLPLLAANDPLASYAERGFAHFGPATASLRLKLSEEAS